MKNGIVIPCYNEADRLKFDEFQSFLDNNRSFLICFVNDGSTDKTLEQLESFASKNIGQVHLCNLTENGGKAEAVRQGVKYILKETNVKNVGFIDADLATGFEDYKRLVHVLKLGRYELVLGSRKKGKVAEIDRSVFRSLASGIIGFFIRLIIGMPIQDTQCGAKVFERNLAKQIFEKKFLSKWLFDVEMLIRIQKIYKSKTMDKVMEVGLNSWEEIEGSKITLKDSLRFPLQLLEICFDYNIKPLLYNYQRIITSYTGNIFSKAA